MNTSRNYPLLLAGQFLGAFGDNFLLAAILGPLTFQHLSGAITGQQVNLQNALFSGVFFVPFILLAPLAGYFNDRRPKTSGLLWGNLLKLAGTTIGAFGVWRHAGDFQASHVWQIAGYALVGIGACMYSPAKYGILPEIVPSSRLVKANGIVEMLTLVAILGGLWAGAALFDATRALTACYAAAIVLYLGALALNALMQRTPQNTDARLQRSFIEFGQSLLHLIRQPRLGRVLLGCGLFWFAGAVLRGNLQAWGLGTLLDSGVAEITNQKLALLKVGLIAGIVAGSLLAGQLHRVGDLRRVPHYAWLMAASVLALGLAGGSLGLAIAVILLFCAGGFAGLLLIPLNAALQHEGDRTQLGKTIAIQNFIDYLAMLIGAGFLQLLSGLALTPGQIFAALSVTLGLFAGALRFGRSPNRSAASSPASS